MRRPDSISGRSPPEWAVEPERGNRLALLFFVRLALFMRRPAARWLLHPICAYFVLFAGKARSASKDYLRRALAREPRAGDIYRHFHAFASTLLDRVFLLKGRYAQFDIRTHGDNIVAGMVARGEGGFLLGAHMGSFEVIRSLADDARGMRVSLVMYEENAQKLNSVLKAVKPDIGLHIIALGKVDAMLKVEQALERGEFVGMLGDRTIAGEGTVACSFLGGTAQFPVGPFRLAAMLGRPVVLMFGLYRGGNRYDIHFERLAEPAPGTHRSERMERSIRNYVERLEHYSRIAPYNWFNFYDYWK